LGTIFISPPQLLEGDYTTPAALITFDDGMQGYFQNAVPILKEFSIPSIIFLNMAPIEGEIFWLGLVAYLTDDPLFREFVRKESNDDGNAPLFLRCSKEIVDDYLFSRPDGHLLDAARRFYGAFATLDDLRSVNGDPLVYFGNHLYNHYNALKLSPEALREEYLLNEEKILGYSNGLSMFSYPFGQPGTCFNEQVTDLIFSFGAQAIFSSSGRLNRIGQGRFYDRVALDEKAESINDLFFKLRYYQLRNLVRTA